MIEELIFTSSRKGLQPGKSGFCTVACTPGMSAPLVRFLESLSGYRHLYPPGTGQAKGNPVVYANLKTKVGGRSYQILSRVGDAGLDYSNRSNKIAHHLAIQDTSELPCGPGEILSKPELLVSQWDRPSAKLQPRSIDVAVDPPARCKMWETVTGDAGWAGEVLEGLEENRAIYLIVEPATQALSLLKEVLALLPKHKQWQTTFSTFFTKLPPNVECDIRCVIVGSPEATAARRSQSNLVLDLTAPLEVASNSYAEVVRSGQMLETFVEDEPLLEIEPEQESDGYNLEPDGALAAGPPRLNARSNTSMTANKTNGSRKWIPIGGVGVCVALALALIAPFVFPNLRTAILSTETEMAEVVPDENKQSPDDEDESAMEMSGGNQPDSVYSKTEAEAEAAKAEAVVTVAIAKAVAGLTIEAAAKAIAVAVDFAERVRDFAEEGKKIKVKDLKRAVDLDNFLGYLNGDRNSRPERIELLEIGEKHRFGNVGSLVFEIEKGEKTEDEKFKFEIRKSNLSREREWSLYYVDKKKSGLDHYEDFDKVGAFTITDSGTLCFEDDSAALNTLIKEGRKDAFNKLSKSDLEVTCNDGVYAQPLKSPEFFSAVVMLDGKEQQLSITAAGSQPNDFPWDDLDLKKLKKLFEDAEVEADVKKGIQKLKLGLADELTEEYAGLKNDFPRLILELSVDSKALYYSFLLEKINKIENIYKHKLPTSTAIFEAMSGPDGFPGRIEKRKNVIRNEYRNDAGDKTKSFDEVINEDPDIADLKILSDLADHANGEYFPVEERLKKFFKNPIRFSAKGRELYLFIDLEGHKYWNREKMEDWYRAQLKKENNRKAGD